ncbi:MAG: hypothetical protein V7K27_31735 [Nostoc sp.]
MHNLSDADFVLSIPAVTTVQEQLRAIAPVEFTSCLETALFKVTVKAA